MSTLTITRIARSSVLIDFDGHRVLTDPWFSEKFGYYHGEPYSITLEALPRLSGVVVSHDHYDHYDMNAFQAYPDRRIAQRDGGNLESCPRSSRRIALDVVLP